MPSLGWYYISVILSNLRLGAYFVLIAWSALEVSNKISVVGHMFLIGSATSIVFGPFLGALVDRKSRKFFLIIGQIIITLATIIPFITHGYKIALESLYCTALLNALGTAITTGASSGIFQKIVGPERRRQVRAVYGALQQASLVIGTGVAGFAISLLGAKITFLVITLAAVGNAVVSFLLPDSHSASVDKGGRSYWAETLEGLSYSFKTPVILILSVSVALAFSVAQLTNTILPSFIRDTAGASSELYGLVEAAWAIGGVIVSIKISYFLHCYPLKHFEFLSLMLLGMFTIGFTMAYTSPNMLIILHAFMGACFSATRVLSDGHLLKICPEHMIGRMQSAKSAITSLSGIIVYLLPTILPFQMPVRVSYVTWGVSLVFMSMCLWYGAYKYRSSFIYEHFNKD